MNCHVKTTNFLINISRGIICLKKEKKRKKKIKFMCTIHLSEKGKFHIIKMPKSQKKGHYALMRISYGDCRIEYKSLESISTRARPKFRIS